MGRIATCLFRRFVRERLSLRGVDVVVTDFAAGLPHINPFKNTCRLSACLTEPVFDGGALALPECSVEFTRCGVASVDISVTAGDYGAVFF